MPLHNLTNKLPSVVSHTHEFTSISCNPRKELTFKPTVVLPSHRFAVEPQAKLNVNINAFNGNKTNFGKR